jgi:hypothetical protein
LRSFTCSVLPAEEFGLGVFGAVAKLVAVFCSSPHWYALALYIINRACPSLYLANDPPQHFSFSLPCIVQISLNLRSCFSRCLWNVLFSLKKQQATSALRTFRIRVTCHNCCRMLWHCCCGGGGGGLV